MGCGHVQGLMTPPSAYAPCKALTRTPPLVRRGEAKEKNHAFLSQAGAG
jgi:hypothetical protein